MTQGKPNSPFHRAIKRRSCYIVSTRSYMTYLVAVEPGKLRCGNDHFRASIPRTHHWGGIQYSRHFSRIPHLFFPNTPTPTPTHTRQQSEPKMNSHNEKSPKMWRQGGDIPYRRQFPLFSHSSFPHKPTPTRTHRRTERT